MRRSAIIAFVAALAPLAAVTANESEHHHGSMFDRWDTNSDGVVTRAEVEQAASQHAGKMFDTLDANGDGTLTKEEAAKAHESKRTAMREKAEERFKAADKNGDGSVSKDEAAAEMPQIAQRFDQLDANKDGSLTAEELRQAHKHRDRHREGQH
jgi:Ca2+-binding EF-hand superfamily protein